MIVLMAVLLIVSCVSIYQSGSRPFSREVIELYAGRLSILGILCLLVVIIGLIIPDSAEKTKAIRDLNAQLVRYSADIPAAIKEQQLRKMYRIISAIACTCFAVYPVIYFLDVTHFSVTDVNGDIMRASLVALIPTAVAMAINLLRQKLEMTSIHREIEIYRQQEIKPGKAPEKKNVDQKKINVIRVVLLVSALIMVVIGAFNGGAADVLGKAIRICTECIGLG